MLHCCRANNGPTMLNRNEAWKYDNSTIRIASKCGNALGNFDRIAHTGGYQPKAERWGRRLDRTQIWSPCCIGWLKQHRNSLSTWRTFLKKLQPFSSDRKLEIGEARDIPLWPRQVRNESRSDRISNARKNDR